MPLTHIMGLTSWARYVKLRVVHAPGMPGTFSPPPRVSDPDMHHATCVTHVPGCISGSLTNGFLWSRWRRKRSQHSRRMSNTQFYVSGKRPMDRTVWSMIKPNFPGSHTNKPTDHNDATISGSHTRKSVIIMCKIHANLIMTMLMMMILLLLMTKMMMTIINGKKSPIV